MWLLLSLMMYTSGWDMEVIGWYNSRNECLKALAHVDNINVTCVEDTPNA